MHDDEPFWFPAVGCKKDTAAFDGGRLTSALAAASNGLSAHVALRVGDLIAPSPRPGVPKLNVAAGTGRFL